MNKEEINFLKEHIEGICRYKGLQQELTYDVSLDVLQRICLSLDYLQQKIDKVTELLSNWNYDESNFDVDRKNINKLLSILKGSDKE